MSVSPKSSKEDIGFVLVHGAGLDVWVWEELVSFVDAPMLPAAFPAREADQSARDDLRLADYTDAVVEQVNEWEVSRVILVTHSIGGAVCIETASRLANRVEGFHRSMCGDSRTGAVVSDMFSVPSTSRPADGATVRQYSTAGARHPSVALCGVV